MDIQERLQLPLIGVVSLKWSDENGFKRTMIKKNAIQPQAKEILAKRLIQHPTSVIDQIKLYNGVNLVFAQPITGTLIIAPQEVQFQALFSKDSFSGDFTEARLNCSSIADFSILNGLDATKSSTEGLLITWNIQII
jgi:hypothetical protein